MKWLRRSILVFALLLVGPLSMAAGDSVNIAADWRHASRASAGIAPDPGATREALVQVYAARAFGWRGALAVHSWIAIKPEGAQSYTTFEVIGWYAFRGGDAINVHEGDPDRRWFGAKPEVLAELRGPAATRAIGKIKKAIADYPYKKFYRTWPGPNSNTFVAHVARNVPELRLDLPPTAIGKDFIPGGAPLALAPSATGIQISLFGLFGVLLALEEGIEINVLGLSFGVDPTGPALRLPGIGRLGN
ncbi:MAG: DUF3750 domain-containing protein [Alphaproteobacteria bacterium]